MRNLSRTKAMTRAIQELAGQRLLMTSRAYRQAYDARVAELLAQDRTNRENRARAAGNSQARTPPADPVLPASDPVRGFLNRAGDFSGHLGLRNRVGPDAVSDGGAEIAATGLDSALTRPREHQAALMRQHLEGVSSLS